MKSLTSLAPRWVPVPVPVVGLALGLLATLGGCHSDGSRSGRPGTGEVRNVRELPKVNQQILLDYSTGGEVWAARRESVLADPAQAQFLVDNLVLEAVRAFDSGRVANPYAGRNPYDQAQAELARMPEYAVPVLGELLTKPDDIVALVAADTLVVIGRPAIPAMLEGLASAQWKVRRRAADLAGKLPHAGPEEPEVREVLVGLLQSDPEWVVRAQAARSLGERGARDRVTEPTRVALMRGLTDEDLGVARRAAEGLGLLGDPKAEAALRRFQTRCTQEGNLEGLRDAETALRAIRSGN